MRESRWGARSAPPKEARVSGFRGSRRGPTGGLTPHVLATPVLDYGTLSRCPSASAGFLVSEAVRTRSRRTAFRLARSFPTCKVARAPRDGRLSSVAGSAVHLVKLERADGEWPASMGTRPPERLGTAPPSWMSRFHLREVPCGTSKSPIAERGYTNQKGIRSSRGIRKGEGSFRPKVRPRAHCAQEPEVHPTNERRTARNVKSYEGRGSCCELLFPGNFPKSPDP